MASSTAETQAPRDVAASEIIGTLEQARRQFLALVDHVRPELLRYCARMTGSIADGEDVVQETLARACFELPQLKELPLLRPWLFRIAHHRAIDHWRHEARRASEPLDAAPRHRRRGRARARPRRRAPAGSARRGLVVPRPGAGAARLRHPEGRARAFDRRDRGRAGPERSRGQGGPASWPRRAPARPRPRRCRPRARRRRRRPSSATPASSTPTTGTASVRCSPTTCASTWSRGARPPDGATSATISTTTRSSGDWHMVPAWFDGREVLAVLSDADGVAAALLHRARLARRPRRHDPRFPLRRLHRPGGRVRARIADRRAGIVHGRTRSHAMKTELFYLLLTAILTGCSGFRS